MPAVNTTETRAAAVALRIARTICDNAGADISAERWRDALLDPLANFLNRPGKLFRGGLVTASWVLGVADFMTPV